MKKAIGNEYIPRQRTKERSGNGGEKQSVKVLEVRCDLKTAKARGVHAIAISFGYNGKYGIDEQNMLKSSAVRWRVHSGRKERSDGNRPAPSRVN